MSKMSQLFIDSAPSRAESAEHDAAYLRDVMRRAARDVYGIASDVLRVEPNSLFAAELVRRMDRVIQSLRCAAETA